MSASYSLRSPVYLRRPLLDQLESIITDQKLVGAVPGPVLDAVVARLPNCLNVCWAECECLKTGAAILGTTQGAEQMIIQFMGTRKVVSLPLLWAIRYVLNLRCASDWGFARLKRLAACGAETAPFLEWLVKVLPAAMVMAINVQYGLVKGQGEAVWKTGEVDLREAVMSPRPTMKRVKKARTEAYPCGSGGF